MKKTVIIICVVLVPMVNVFGQCNSLFTFSTNFETVSFFNQSNMTNTHFYWNFGDGRSSHFKNPIHTFPDNGNYLVTLFSNDTVMNCSSYYEYWIHIEKYPSGGCQPIIYDSISYFGGETYLEIVDISVNCEDYQSNYDGGSALNVPGPGGTFYLGGSLKPRPFKIVSRVQYSKFVSIGVPPLLREAYQTTEYRYSSSKNYNDCSANFEFSVVSQNDLGQTIFFEAMNKKATKYTWYIPGFGGGITSSFDTISKFYPYSSDGLWFAGLITEDDRGCIDSIYHNLLIRNDINTLAGLDEMQNEIDVHLFPNPFSDKTTLYIPNLENCYSFSLFNANGQLLRLIENPSNEKVIIERENLSNGMYFYVIQLDNNSKSRGKLVVE